MSQYGMLIIWNAFDVNKISTIISCYIMFFVCNWSLGCVVWHNYDVVEFQPRSETTTALDFIDILMCSFLTPLVIHRPMVLSRRQLPPSPLCPLSATHHPVPLRPPLPTSAPRVIWTPGRRQGPSIRRLFQLAHVLLSHLSLTVVSLCLPHLSGLAPLARPVQPLIHAPLNSFFFLHPGGIPTNRSHQWDHTICRTI